MKNNTDAQKQFCSKVLRELGTAGFEVVKVFWSKSKETLNLQSLRKSLKTVKHTEVPTNFEYENLQSMHVTDFYYVYVLK